MIATIQWAEKNKARWAFSDRNAGANVVKFYKTLDDLKNIDWSAVVAADWRDMIIQEGKHAEFLLYESFPWELVEKIGVHNNIVRQKVIDKLTGEKQPLVSVEPSWYY